MWGLLSSLSSFADPVTWKLSFADELGKEVGTGQFTYDPETSKDMGLIRPWGGDSFDVGTVNTAIDSISVNFLDETYEDEEVYSFFGYIYSPIVGMSYYSGGWLDSVLGSQLTNYNDSESYLSNEWVVWGPIISSDYYSGDSSGNSAVDYPYTETVRKRLGFTLSNQLDLGASFTGEWVLYESHTIIDHVWFHDSVHDGDEISSGTVTATLVTTPSCDAALYTPNKGEISINTLDIYGKPYNVVLKKTGGYDFTITKIWRDRSDRACQQAQYISNKGIIDIPMLDINGKNYKVMMKKKSGYDFVIKQISRIK